MAGLVLTCHRLHAHLQADNLFSTTPFRLIKPLSRKALSLVMHRCKPKTHISQAKCRIYNCLPNQPIMFSLAYYHGDTCQGGHRRGLQGALFGRRSRTALGWYQKKDRRHEETPRTCCWGRRVRGKHLEANSRRHALRRGHFMLKRDTRTPRRRAAHRWPMLEQRSPRVCSPWRTHAGACTWRSSGAWRRPSREQGAAERNCYTHDPNLLHCPSLSQRNWDRLSLSHSENKEFDTRKGDG